MKDREFGCICELDANGDPVVANYDACPLHSGKRRDVIASILASTGKLTKDDIDGLPEKILTEINKI